MGRLNMLPVLMYHGLHADAHARGRFDPVYSIDPDDFARQLDWLLAHGYRSVPLARAESWPGALRSDRREVVITFDDGDVSNVEVALPLLQARGMTAEFFITTDYIGQAGMLSAADVRRLADADMGVGSHGRSHAFLEDLSPDALWAELRDSRRRLQDIIGREVTTLALPGGRGRERERRAALAAGYRTLLGSVPGPNRAPRADDWLQRLAVTRGLGLDRFAGQVGWRGLRPRMAQARFFALRLPKRVLGNVAYERIRARLLLGDR